MNISVPLIVSQATIANYHKLGDLSKNSTYSLSVLL